jgi:hypothetical protein
MSDSTGDQKMHGGDLSNDSGARGSSGRGGAKARLSPELQELMHMLSSLEDQFTRDGKDN